MPTFIISCVAVFCIAVICVLFDVDGVDSRGLTITGAVVAILLLPVVLMFVCRGYKVFGVGPRPSWPSLTNETAFSPRSREQGEADTMLPYTRFVCISDTHSQHHGVKNIPDGDVLLHAGDFSMTAERSEIEDFNEWLGTLPHRHKIVIAGNHDFTFDEAWCSDPKNMKFWAQGNGKSMDESERANIRALLTNCTYIQDELITVEGITIYGTPAQPPLVGHQWAFTGEQKDLRETFSKIPDNVDVLLTHSPPFGHGDRTVNMARFGCKELLEAVRRAKPQFHVFGHVHDGYGVTQEGGTTFVNASSCTTFYHPLHDAIIFDVARRGTAA